MDLNVLIRGQSNALLFAERGGAWALEQGLEARLGVDVHILAERDTDTSTIHSGTAFMSWDTDGQQASLLRYVNDMPADLKDNPTAVLWMHNEYDQGDMGLTTDAWLNEVRVDADLLRDALGQGAATTPYTFVPIRYPYGGNWEAIGDGIGAFDNDPSFNADISWEAGSLTMDGDGFANSSHMGDADAAWLGGKLAESMAVTLRPLANGGAAPPEEPVVTPPVLPPEQPPVPVEITAGQGPDALVLRISQDAYQGNAQYTVSVDGVQVGGTFAAAAWHSAGQSDTLTLKGDWGPGEHRVEVAFLNDAWDGTPETDRNLHLDGASYNGQALDGASAALMAAGAAGFAFADAAPPVVERPAFAGTAKADLFDVDADGGMFTGGAGRDLYLFDAGDGHATVADFAGGADKLVFLGFDPADVATAAGTEAGTAGLLLTYGGGGADGGTVFLAGVSALADKDLAFG